MATFSKSAFDAVRYLAKRPSYPDALYHRLSLLITHEPKLIIDLGCGPGTATVKLAQILGGRAVGIDPSPQMISHAQESTRHENVEFRVGFAEESLKDFKDGEVDFVGAAQAAHWFDHPRLNQELKRVMKPGGTVCFWGYGEMFFPDNEKATALIEHHSHIRLGPYWEQPGRSIVESLYSVIPFPSAADWGSFQRIRFDQKGSATYDSSAQSGDQIEPIILERVWTMPELSGYFETWSSLHTFRHSPENVGAKDAVEEVMDSLYPVLGISRQDEGKAVNVAWPMGLMCFTRN